MSPTRPSRSRLSPLLAALAVLIALSAAGSAGAETVHLEQPFAAGAPLAGELDGLARTARGLAPAGVAGAASGVYRSGPIAAPLGFTAVGPHWRAELPADTALELELSTSADGAAWTPFHRVLPDPHAEPAALLPDGRPNPFAGDTVGALTHRSRGDGRWVRYRVTLRRGADAAGDPVLERLTLTFIDSSRPHPEAGREERRPAPPPVPGAYPKPPVNSRGAWGARPPVCTYSYCSVTHVGIHHTAGVAEYSCQGFDDCAADVRAIQAYHMDVNGWCDIGYNYQASSDGALWEGRGGGDDVVGAHDGHNCGSMGVANMGYYHPPYDHPWTEAQIDAVAELSAWKADQKGIDPFGASWYAGYGGVVDNVYGHRDVRSTACPGDTIYPRLGELRVRIDEKLSGGGGGDEIVRDNPSAITRGDWTTGTSAPDRYGADYYWTSTGTGDRRLCAWTVDLPSSGTWEVSFWWSQGSNRNPATRVGVKQGALHTFTLNQQTGGGRWNPVGSFAFSAGTVRLGVVNDGELGWVVICDAVRLRKLD